MLSEANYLKKPATNISILDHVDVPKHTILSLSKAASLLEHYGITLEDLPKIKMDDPVMKEIGGNVGDVIEIMRQSPTATISKYYRVVVE